MSDALNAGTARRWRRRGQFSLMEVMVVLIIIGLIVGLVGPAIFKHLEQGRAKAAKSQVILLRQCVNDYYLDLQEYPRSLDELVRNPNNPKWRGPYLQDHTSIPKDPWGNDYQYQSPGREGRNYDIYSFGKGGAAGGSDKYIYFDSEL